MGFSKMGYKWPTVGLVDEENPWVSYMRKQTMRKNNCINLVVTSAPGKGKSWSLLSQFCMIDPDFDINEQCVFKAKKLIKTFQEGKLKKGKPFMFDEAGVDASSAKWQSEINQALSLFYQTNRALNHIFGLSLPYLSFLSKSVRKLMNCHWRAEGYTRDNLTIIKPFVLEFNDELDRFYRKRLLVRLKDHSYTYCNELKLPKPPENIVKEYERMKSEFTNELYQSLSDKIDMKEKLENIKGKINITVPQQEVLELLKEGKTSEEVRQLTGRKYVVEITNMIKRMQSHGVKIQENQSKDHTVTYVVDDSMVL